MRGLNNTHSGNISARIGNSIYITRTGSMLHSLKRSDIIKVNILENESKDKKASVELLVHRAIYRSDEKVQAVVHAHAPYCIVEANDKDIIIPFDDEGRYYLKRIPVINVKNTLGSQKVAEKIKDFVKTDKSVIIARHGVFAWGESLQKAYQYLSVANSSCKLNFLSANKKPLL